jgi:hypothetical protein
MTISMYQASVPLMTKMLINLKAILQKAATHAKAKKIEESALLNARLYPDMFVLTRQVQIACDFARGTAARLAGLEPPAYEENEQSLAELVSRIDRSVDYLQSVKAQQIDGSETREIVRPVRGEPKKFIGINYLLQFALPNFFFHVTTAYAILRHNGIEIGKYDYVGALD